MKFDKSKIAWIYSYYFILYIVVMILNGFSITAINGKISLVSSIVWMLVSLVVCFVFLKKKCNRSSLLIYSLVNAAMGGIAISAYYSIRNVSPFSSLLLIAIFGAIMLASYILINVVQNKLAFIKISLIATGLAFILSLIVWGSVSVSLGSSLTFLFVIYLCFTIGFYIVVKRDLKPSSVILYASLLMFAGLLIVVIAALTEGDGLDILGIDWPYDSKKKSKIVTRK